MPNVVWTFFVFWKNVVTVTLVLFCCLAFAPTKSSTSMSVQSNHHVGAMRKQEINQPLWITPETSTNACGWKAVLPCVNLWSCESAGLRGQPKNSFNIKVILKVGSLMSGGDLIIWIFRNAFQLEIPWVEAGHLSYLLSWSCIYKLYNCLQKRRDTRDTQPSQSSQLQTCQPEGENAVLNFGLYLATFVTLVLSTQWLRSHETWKRFRSNVRRWCRHAPLFFQAPFAQRISTSHIELAAWRRIWIIFCDTKIICKCYLVPFWILFQVSTQSIPSQWNTGD